MAFDHHLLNLFCFNLFILGIYLVLVTFDFQKITAGCIWSISYPHYMLIAYFLCHDKFSNTTFSISYSGCRL